MKVNGIDIRKFNAKQLTVDVQPPSFANKYEWLPAAVMPTELDTEVQMGHLKLEVYIKGKNRNDIIRSASDLISLFSTKSCKLQLDGYKGLYVGFITKTNYQKKKVKDRYIINAEFDGYFIDDEITHTYDGETNGSITKAGTRDTPCIVEIYAKSALTEYTISGLGDDITVDNLAAGKTLVIDGTTGLVTLDGVNAFDKVTLWSFPIIKERDTEITMTNTRARVTIRYTPMWI